MVLLPKDLHLVRAQAQANAQAKARCEKVGDLQRELT